MRSYVAIDLKSFYASVECAERKLDPLSTNLVVADASRTEKTICLAVSPSLKAYGIPGRARLFEVVQKVEQVNSLRRQRAPGHQLTGASYDAKELKQNPTLAVDYIAAPPRMAYYIRYSTGIYSIYLKYAAPEDIHVYSVDEVFIDVTNYLNTYQMTARQLVTKMMLDVLETTGITATAGIGTNLYLCKIAMDIVAKHVEPDENGVRIAQLDEQSYRRLLWTHRPLTDFWRVGRGYATKLEKHGLFTMGDIARCSIGEKTDFRNEDLLYRLFGVNAELLIDHAWGWEPCTIADIKAFKPSTNSISSGQVLQCPYEFEKAKIIVREMTDLLVLKLVEQRQVTDQMVLNIGYDVENLLHPSTAKAYQGSVTTDYYGRKIPKHAHTTIHLGEFTSSTKLIVDAVVQGFEKCVDHNLLVRRIHVTASHVVPEEDALRETACKQISLFADYNAERQRQEALKRERQMQQAMLEIKKKFGKNAILKGTNLQDGATTIQRNRQIGGHRA